MEKYVRSASESNRKSIIQAVFLTGTAFILLVSIYDAFLVFKFRAVINELNPICNWLIKLEPTYVSVFLFAKIASSFVVVSVLGILFRFRQSSGFLAMSSLVLFQIGLMGFLHFNEPIANFRDENSMVAFFSPPQPANMSGTYNPQLINGSAVTRSSTTSISNSAKQPPRKRNFARETWPSVRKNRRLRKRIQKLSNMVSHAGPRRRVF